MRRPFTLSILALALVAGIAGCGSGGSSSTSTTAATTPMKTATSSHTTVSSGTAATVGTAKTPLGTILVNGQGRTLYLFVADTGSSSTCSSACAAVWPPLLTKGAPKATGSAMASKLGTTKRSDGTTQVTYAGHPLYTYTPDSAAGQTTGQGVSSFGAPWYVLTSSGAQVTSSGGSSTTSGGSSNGY